MSKSYSVRLSDDDLAVLILWLRKNQIIPFSPGHVLKLTLSTVAESLRKKTSIDEGEISQIIGSLKNSHSAELDLISIDKTLKKKDPSLYEEKRRKGDEEIKINP